MYTQNDSAPIRPEPARRSIPRTFMLTAYYSNIPKEIVEAAKIDGASTWQIYFRIMIPLGKPALATQAIINTLFAWNELPKSSVNQAPARPAKMPPRMTLR